MESLAPYYAIANQDVDAGNGHDLNKAMLESAAACGRVNVIRAELEDALLRAEHRQREALRAADPDVSEARLAASVKYLVLDERKAFQEADNLAKTLHGRFKALQSALSFLRSELSMR